MAELTRKCDMKMGCLPKREYQERILQNALRRYSYVQDRSLREENDSFCWLMEDSWREWDLLVRGGNRIFSPAYLRVRPVFWYNNRQFLQKKGRDTGE